MRGLSAEARDMLRRILDQTVTTLGRLALDIAIATEGIP